MEEVQTSKNLYLTIYKLLKQGIRPSVIEKELGLKKQRINYYIFYLKQQGIIRKLGYGVWEVIKDLTDSELLEEVKKRSTKKSSIGVKEYPSINLHAVILKIPILSGTIKDLNWKIINKINNWIPKYKKYNQFQGLLIRNNNNKSISVFVSPRDIDNLNEARELPVKIATYLYEFFRNKHKVILDFERVEIKNTNVAIHNPFIGPLVRDGDCIKIDLKKNAEKIFEEDHRRAWASVDNSPYKPSIEANDLSWIESYLEMPFILKRLYKDSLDSIDIIKEVSKNQMDLSMVLKQVSDNMIHLTKILVRQNKEGL